MFKSYGYGAIRFLADRLPDDMRVLAFSGGEGISSLFSFDIELVSERADLPLETLLNQQAFLAFHTRGSGVHGVISRLRQGASGKRLTHYHARLEPQMARLGLRRNHRIFQGRTVAQVVARLLEEHGILSDAYQFHLAEPSPPRDYCVQYAESDLAFVERLCQEEGIHYHFVHSPQGHRVVFADHQSYFPKLATAVPFVPPAGLQPDGPVIQAFSVAVQTTVSRVELRDHDFRKAAAPLAYASRSNTGLRAPDIEFYAYPGGLRQTLEQRRGSTMSKRALERCRVDHRQAQGDSDEPLLVSGHLMSLTGHPRADFNDLWLLTSLRHEGRQPQVLEENGGQEGAVSEAPRYANHFTATPWDVIYRPAMTRPPPRMPGCQAARVTGPKGEEVYCDELGRVKVQFYWDREGQGNEHSSCWLRVMSSWAGDRHGAVCLPRVGMEVVVSFLDGDPDQPVVSGCLPDSLHPSPYALPDAKARTVLRSRSLGGSGGYNELAMDDRDGNELLYLRAQRDFEQWVEHDSLLEVGNRQQVLVKGDSQVTLEAEAGCTVGGDRRVLLRSSDHLTVDLGRQVRVGTLLAQHAGQQMQLSAEREVVVEGGASITLRVAGQHLVINGAGIFASSPVQLGGVPAASLVANPLSPGQGGGVQVPGALPASMAPTQAALMQQSRLLGAAYCPVCEGCREGVAALGGVQ
ncbi:type VI secretion system tip protein VgrG [Pseudomonas taiwanensis]|uniref:Type VI secretion system tip protein VgrG n=1 Tax=Pseudomonas taiwanensis TaxID=470150 RepID=A0ABR6V3S4_9PSED|nr:type VI secretion system tip protein VgrG [Pseudomonas taiwanensis]MBC3475166.1 type VI secretion system tip protein VgrG [Pseudomonas taiwanensis]